MSEDFEGLTEADVGEGEYKNTPDEQYKELAEKLAKIEAENAAMRRQMTQAALATPAQAPAPYQAPALDLKGLPDPTVDHEQWESAAAQRIDAHVKARQREDREAQERQRIAQGHAQGLVAQFKAAYPDIAKDEERMMLASNYAWQKGLAKGIDMDRYAASHTEMFFEEVAAEHKRLFGEVKAAADDDAPADRTGGLFGGLEGVGKPTGRGKSKEVLGSVADDLKKVQRSMGLTW